eukprot:6255604-Amphidinium_carterae.1
MHAICKRLCAKANCLQVTLKFSKANASNGASAIPATKDPPHIRSCLFELMPLRGCAKPGVLAART